MMAYRLNQGIRAQLTTVALGAMVLGLAMPASAQSAEDPTVAAPTPVPAPAPAVALPRSEEATTAAEDIVVTGSRIARSGFTAPTPVTALGATELQQFSQANVADSLNRLPSFRPQNTPATSQFRGFIGQQTLDLRGLGDTRTLVLVDGRRFVPSSISGTVDLNLIPSLLVSRKEVVTGGASAAYGSDAVAGVVNILIDNKLDGIRAQAQYGQAEFGDGQEYVAGLAGGTGLFGGAVHVVAGVEYVENKGIGDCLSRSWCARSVRLLPNPTPGVNGVPANLITEGTRFALGSPGGLILNGPLRGTQFGPDGSPQPFQFGQYATFAMLGGSGDYNYFGVGGPKLVARTRHLSAYSHVDADLGAVNAFVDASYGRTRGFNYGNQPLEFAPLTIQRDNPFIPAAIASAMDEQGLTSFGLGRISNDFGFSRVSNVTSVYRIAAGLSGNIAGSWKWDAYYQYGKTRYDSYGRNLKYTARWNEAVDAVRAPNGQIVCRSALANPGTDCRTLNLFGENNYSSDAFGYVMGDAWGRLDYSQHVLAANVQGDLFDLPAGAVTLAVGGEYRSDKASGSADPVSMRNGFFTSNQPPYDGRIGKIEVTEAYAEIVVPLLRDMAFAEALELNGAVRRTHYNTSGSVTTWKGGIVYAPADWIRFRATRSRDIRAPNMGDLFGPRVSTFRGITNPITNVQTLVPAFTGGNPNLKPEIANTLTIGGALTPGGVAEGLRLSVDYYEVKLKGAIAAVGAQQAVNQCYAGATEFCSAVVRDASGLNITQVLELPFNLNRFILRGIDFELNYRLPLDRVSAGLSGVLELSSYATYTKDLITVDSVRAIDRAGQSGRPISSFSGVPHWIIYNTLTYSQDRFTAAMAHRWIQGGLYDSTLIGPDQPGYSPTLLNSVNNNRVKGRNYFDLTLKYLLPVPGEIELYGTVSNLFDTNPPDAPSDGGATNLVYFDPIGRAYRAGVRLRF